MTLSDKEGCPHLLDNLKQTCVLNGFNSTDTPQVHIVAISWGIFSPQVIALDAQDIILASDCFYDTKGTVTIITVYLPNFMNVY